MTPRLAGILGQMALGAALAGGVGCSTLEPKNAPAECNSDAECPDDTVCDFGICRDNSGDAPSRYLGFDFQEVAGAGGSQFRAELTSCDDEAGDDGLTFSRPQATQTLSLAVFLSEPVDPDNPTQDEVLAATFVVSAPSRFAREAPRRSVQHPTIADDMSVVDTTLRWPRYHLDNELPNALRERGVLLWEVQPTTTEEEGPARASRFLVLAPPVGFPIERPCSNDADCCYPSTAQCDPEDLENTCVQALGVCRPYANPLTRYEPPYEDGCNRTFDGRVVRVDESLNVNGAVGGARVSVRYADTTGAPRLGLVRIDEVPVEDREKECSENADCVIGTQFCNLDTQQCETALAGLAAWSGTSFEPIDGEPAPAEVEPGDFSAAVFTYCSEPEAPLTRSYAISVTPPEESALPTMIYDVDVEFDPIQGGQKPDADLDGKSLCLPDWGASTSIELSLSGDPVQLVDGDPNYACCDLDCLPRTRADAMTVPTAQPNRCNGSGGGASPAVRVETPFTLEDDQALAWLADDSPCVPPGVLGTLRRTASCSTDDGMCSVDFVAGSVDQPRTYTVRIEPPTGSVLGSIETTLEVGPDGTTGSLAVELPPRTLVHGRVRLGSDVCTEEDESDGDCGSEGASVLAERLRMPGKSVGNTPGPYFHEVSTFHDPSEETGGDGAYALPLDSGVWVLTALPNSGTAGGPAPIVLLDLRAPEVTDATQDFDLGAGILVTLDVKSFDRRTQVVPLDIGSWALDGLVHPARADEEDPALRLVDLGAPEECFSAAEGGARLGCRIRRLIGGTSLPPTQVGQVRFTARDLGGNEAKLCNTQQP